MAEGVSGVLAGKTTINGVAWAEFKQREVSIHFRLSEGMKM